MQTLAQDLRYAVRNLRQAPGFAAVVILTLALGIGANSAIFSVVNGVVLKPLEYRQPDNLVFISSNFPGESYGAQFWMSAPEYFQYREQSTSFDDMGVYTTGEVSITGTDTPIRVPAGFASATLFTTLGVEPVEGRLFSAEEDLPGGDATVLLSYELWTGAFGARQDLLGDTLVVNGAPSTVIGIMPPRFDVNDNGVQVWVPLQFDPENPGSFSSHFLFGVGRLLDGVSPEQARAETDVLVAGWLETYPDTSHIRPDGHEIQFEPLIAQVVGDVRPALLTLLGAVGFVLLIACANVGNLLLARAESRQKEIGVRTALGAGRGRLLRQFVTESTLLALIGGIAGLAVGNWAVRALLATNSGSIPRLAEIGLDGSVLLFTLGVSLLTGLLFGLAPLLHLTADSLNASLRDGRSTAGSARHQLRQLLVVSEIALAVVLVVGAGLMLRSFSALQSVDPGFNHDGALTFRLFLPNATYPTPPEQIGFYRELKTRFLEQPGVEGVTLMTGLPPIRRLNANTMQFEGIQFTDEGPPSEVDYWQFVMDDYFETLGIPLLEGRLFEPADAEAEGPVVLVNERMADMYWPEGALGRRIRQGNNGPWMTVIGVVADVKNGGMDQVPGTELYFFTPQAAAMGFGQNTMNIVLRTSMDPTGLSDTARRTVWSIDPTLPLTNLQTMDEAVFGSMARPRFLTLLLGVFGGLALALAAVGTYGVMSYFVAERSREMGIRMALGAESGGVLTLVLLQSLKIAAIGLVIGIGAAFGLSRFVESWLFGVSAFDTVTFVAVPAVLCAVAVAACLVPALRATRVDPIVVLKAE